MIYHSRKFEIALLDLPERIQDKAEFCENLFRENPFNLRLKTHKLHGKLSGLWSFSIDYKNRVVFEFDGDDVIFLDVGDHDLYK